ncbi:MAG: YncE family protein [Thermoplasmata archaeon]|nr:YncE family protein [Thermoplasmata archaeon]
MSRASAACPNNTGINPAWLAYDAANQTFWVAASPSCVDVFTMSVYGYPSNLTASIPVGTNPFGVAVDNVTNDVFVSNPGSNNVSVISATNDTSVASVAVGTNPHGVAFDWVSNSIYVANTGSNNVTVISGTSLAVVGTVAVGSSPIGVVADPKSGEVFVANFGSANVTAISDSTNLAVAQIPTGNGSYGVAWDNASNEVFVSNEQSNNISVIDAASDSVTATVPVPEPVQLQGLAYDPATEQVWVGAGRAFAVVINASSETLVGYAGADPAGVAYDPANGAVCVTNTGNVTFECLDFRFVSTADPLTFHESGLPSGFPWSVVLDTYVFNTTTDVSRKSNISFGAFGFYEQYDFRIPSTHDATASPANGSVIMKGPPLVVNVSFTPVLGFNQVSFNETGLPNGTSWSVQVNGSLNSSTGPTNIFWLPNGTYNFGVVQPFGYASSPRMGSVVVAGSAQGIAVAFTPDPTYAVFFTETGLPDGRVWSVYLGGVAESDTVGVGVPPSVTFSEPNGTYAYRVGAVSGFTLVSSSGMLTVNGSSKLIGIAFTAVPESIYDVTFTESRLAIGTNWSVTLGAATLASSTNSVGFVEPNGTYRFVVNSPPGLGASPARGSIVVNGSAASQTIVFSAVPVPLSANFTYQIQSAGCETDGGVTNLVVLNAVAGGGAPPYAYAWTSPTGIATTALTATTTTYGKNNTVTLAVSDSAGKTATHSALLPMQLPPCPPPPFKTYAAGALSAQDWAIVALVVALAAVTGAAIWLGTRGKGGTLGKP